VQEKHPAFGMVALAIAIGSLATASPALRAQVMIERAHWTATVEGYANFIGGRSQGEEGREATGRSRLDAGLRVLALR